MPDALDRSGPRRFELLFVDPVKLDRAVPMARHADLAPAHSALPWSPGGDWDRQHEPLADMPRFQALIKHLRDGVPWEETGIYDIVLRGLRQRQRVAANRGAVGKFDGLSSEEEVYARYERIDAMVETVRAEGRLRLPWEIDPDPLAQLRGIHVHLDRNGDFIFAGAGFHRLAIALALGLPTIPVSLKLAHKQAVSAGHLALLRKQREEMLKNLGLSLPKEALGIRPAVYAEYRAGRTG